MSSTCNHGELELDINITPYDEPVKHYIIVDEHHEGFSEVASALADECDLYLYQGVLYNMPFRLNHSAPYYCVTRGRYLGVFDSHSWDTTAQEVQSQPDAIYFGVKSLGIGENIVRSAIRAGNIVNLVKVEGSYKPKHFSFDLCPFTRGTLL